MSQDQARLEALYRVSSVLGTSLDLDQVLAQAMDAVIELTGAERGFLVLLEPDSTNWKMRTARNFGHEAQQGQDMVVSRTVIDEVITTVKGVLTTDAQNDPRFSSSQSVVFYALRSVMCAPLLARGEVIGAIYVDNRAQRGLFDQSALELLSAFAIQAAIAIDNARLYTLTDQALLRIVHNSPVAIVTLALSSKVTTWNPAAQVLFGYTPEEANGQFLDDLITPPDKRLEAAENLQLLLKGESIHQNTQRRCTDGTILDVELLAVPEIVDGEQIGILVIFHDITQVQNYLRHVVRMTDTAAEVESGSFSPAALDDVAQRSDGLGQLARVFQHMAREVYAREQALKQQVHALTIKLDEAKKERQVAEITETEYFRQLQSKANSFRNSGRKKT
jgi:PAS domain S-box-containing protein